MVTREEFAELALTLPDTTPRSHFGQPDFRVRGKIFCGLDRAAERASIKVRKDVQALLIESRPEAFAPAAGAWGESGWTYVELPRVELDELRELVTDAWRLIAPAKLVAQHPHGPDAANGLVITVSRKTPARNTKRVAKKSKQKPKKKVPKTPAPAASPKRQQPRRARALRSAGGPKKRSTGG